jgi:hypothetical protein
MRGAELREWLDRLETEPVPEPDPAFVARLEADLRAMDHTAGAEAETDDRRPAARRSRRARLLVAAGPVAALTVAAAAAAVTLLPHDPAPKQVTAANPGVTAPAPPPAPPDTEVPRPASTPTTVGSAPWLPPTSPSPSTPPTTAKAQRAVPTGTGTGSNEHPGTTDVPPAPTTTTAVPPTTTPPPATESMTLQCTTAMPSGAPVVRCEWGANTASNFRWYRLWRQSAGSSPAVVFQSDNRPTVTYYDQQVQAGTNYYYKVDVIDGSGNVLAYSPIVSVSCC